MVSHQRSDLLRFVNDDLMAQPGVTEALKVIGIEQATPCARADRIHTGRASLCSAEAWDAFWTLVRGFADVNEALA